ncbi:MAG: hypothetical protein PHP45_07060 [Elusimicrobiales bacterium]|nr:hypothetical protein [Elusimicrobiales bacterium]
MDIKKEAERKAAERKTIIVLGALFAVVTLVGIVIMLKSGDDSRAGSSALSSFSEQMAKQAQTGGQPSSEQQAPLQRRVPVETKRPEGMMAFYGAQPQSAGGASSYQTGQAYQQQGPQSGQPEPPRKFYNSLANGIRIAAMSPMLVKAFLNNQKIVDTILSRPVVKSTLDDPNALFKFATTSKMAYDFLGNPAVVKAMANKDIVKAVSESYMMSQLLQAPGVQALASNPGAVLQIMDKNPQFMSAVNQPGVHKAIADNPITGPLLTGLEALRQTQQLQQSAGGGAAQPQQQQLQQQFQQNRQKQNSPFQSGFGN